MRALQMLKERTITSGIPVIVVTGLSGRSLGIYEDQVDAVVQKPFGREELLSHVNRLLAADDDDNEGSMSP